MPVIGLDDAELKILRECPIVIRPSLRPSKAESERMVRVKRLWAAGYVGGEVGTDGKTLRVRIRDRGRVAIGRVAIGRVALGEGGV